MLELEDGFKIYFAGDTNVFGDMSLIGRIYAPDVARAPDRRPLHDGAARGCGRDRAASASARCVPCHYGTFPILTGNAGDAPRARAAGVEILAPEPGETLTF